MQVSQIKTELTTLRDQVVAGTTAVTGAVNGLKARVAELEAALAQGGSLDVETIAALDSLKSAVTALSSIVTTPPPVES